MGGGISSEHARLVAAQLHEELAGAKLTVMKWRSGDGWVRGPIVTNPDWYQRLCSRHEYPRKRYPKPRTKIKRWYVLEQLQRIADGLPCSGFYHDELQRIIAEESEFREFQTTGKEAVHVGADTEAGREDFDW